MLWASWDGKASKGKPFLGQQSDDLPDPGTAFYGDLLLVQVLRHQPAEVVEGTSTSSDTTPALKEWPDPKTRRLREFLTRSTISASLVGRAYCVGGYGTVWPNSGRDPC